MASSECQIGKAQCGCPKRAELPDVNINTVAHKLWWASGQSTWHINGWTQQRLRKFGFHFHTTALWPVEQGSILSAKFDCPVACQYVSLLVAAKVVVKPGYSL